MRNVIFAGLLISHLFAAGIAAEPEPTDLKTYYLKEKAYWDSFIDTHCKNERESKKCKAALGMQETYVYLLTDLMRDKTAQRFGTRGERVVYEVPVVPTSNEESASLIAPQIPVENIP